MGNWALQIREGIDRAMSLVASRSDGAEDPEWDAAAFHALSAAMGASGARLVSPGLAAYLKEFCESPIERALVAGAVCAALVTEKCSHVMLYDPDLSGPLRDPSICWHRFAPDGGAFCDDQGYSRDEKRHEDYTFHDILWLRPQREVGSYRVDLVAHFTNGAGASAVASARDAVKCAIECDGHDFHERTKEQAARDKSRDRTLLSAGYPVMRSEIWKDPVACAGTFIDFLINQERGNARRSGGA